jgi:hypothetical protein
LARQITGKTVSSSLSVTDFIGLNFRLSRQPTENVELRFNFVSTIFSMQAASCNMNGTGAVKSRFWAVFSCSTMQFVLMPYLQSVAMITPQIHSIDNRRKV